MLQYLEFMDRVHQINGRFDLNSHETRVLELIAIAHHVDQPISVGDLISQKHIASQATLYSVVKRLIEKKLVVVKKLKSDSRIKTVTLTKSSRSHFEKLQRELDQAAIPWAS